jgi:hypothetical protein
MHAIHWNGHWDCHAFKTLRRQYASNSLNTSARNSLKGYVGARNSPNGERSLWAGSFVPRGTRHVRPRRRRRRRGAPEFDCLKLKRTGRTYRCTAGTEEEDDDNDASPYSRPIPLVGLTERLSLLTD